MKITYFRQGKDYTCGPACMRMVLCSIGKDTSEQELAKALGTNKKSGTAQSEFRRYAARNKLRFYEKENASLQDIADALKQGYAVVVCYYVPRDRSDHYSVVMGIKRGFVHFFDPWFGRNHKYTTHFFERRWETLCSEPKQRWFIAMRK